MQDPVTTVPSQMFDGRFFFTNASDEDFAAKWGNITYTFPAHKTSPMVISNATLEEVQNIRKKFAKEYGEREFYKSEKLKNMQTPIGHGESFQGALTYTEADLAPYIQQCLEPLPIAEVRTQVSPQKEVQLRRDHKGKTVSRVLEGDESLLANGQAIE